eukprot:m51a1_g5982 GRIP domain containing protein C (453) ;mRNA; r:252600-254050
MASESSLSSQCIKEARESPLIFTIFPGLSETQAKTAALFHSLVAQSEQDSPADARSRSYGGESAGRVLRPRTSAHASAQRIEELEEALRATREIKIAAELAYQEQLEELAEERDVFRRKYEKAAADLEALYLRMKSRRSYDVAHRGTSTHTAIPSIRPRSSGGTPAAELVPALRSRLSELETVLARQEDMCSATSAPESPIQARAGAGTFSVTPPGGSVDDRSTSSTPSRCPSPSSRAHDEMAVIKDLQKRLAAAEQRAHEERVRAEIACANAARTLGTLHLELSSLRARLSAAEKRNADLEEKLRDAVPSCQQEDNETGREAKRPPRSDRRSAEALIASDERGTPTTHGDGICQELETMHSEELRTTASSLLLLAKEHEKAERALQQRLAELEANAKEGPNVEYIRNSLLRFLEADDQQRRLILPALAAIIGLSDEEKSRVVAASSRKRWM